MIFVVAFAEGIANLAATKEKPICQTPESRLGSNCQLVTELHRTRCGNRDCRPGEGNVKGYTHSTQPYTSPSLPPDALKMPPHEPNPETTYAELVAAAHDVTSSYHKGNKDRRLVLLHGMHDCRAHGKRIIVLSLEHCQNC